MTPRYQKRQLRTGKNAPQLTLVYSARRTLDKLLEFTLAEAIEPANQKTIGQVADALMCRLWIPHTSTIVGMLGVGLSSSNFDELSKWIAQELQTVESEDVHDSLQILERRFRQTVDQLPED